MGGAGDASWVPTFPNARYLMPELDYRHFSPDGAATNDGMRIAFSDSIIPVESQIELWSGEHQLSESVWLRPAAGHTPGSSVVWLDAGAPAVFVGDLTHCPIQLPRPDDAVRLRRGSRMPRRSPASACSPRRRAGAPPSIPAHYPGRGGASVVARGDAFMVDDWLELPAI